MASSSDPASAGLERRDSISAASQNSQTAQEYITSQLQLEADAREALPYQFDTCTYSLGPLRQSLYSCLTCNPPPSDPNEPYNPAGVCYSCHMSCHGEHELVELFTRRNFVCDCGTTRMPATSPCSLRVNPGTGTKGGVHSEEASATNKYNQNFRNRFCGCSQLYDPFKEKGTMFQCLGLGTVEDGGCGEDWWHPECIVGLGRKGNTRIHAITNGNSVEKTELIESTQNGEHETNGNSATTNGDDVGNVTQDGEHPMPPGFPHEDDFEYFICYKCTEAFPWIKKYAGSEGFLSAVPHDETQDSYQSITQHPIVSAESTVKEEEPSAGEVLVSRKRKAEDEDDTAPSMKRTKSSDETSAPMEPKQPTCKYAELPPLTASKPISLFLKEDFREYLCRCPTCFPLLIPHPQLLEEEEPFEPPLSASSAAGGESAGSRSLLDRGEAALSNIDRVRAIEGVMVYNHLRDKVKDFLKPFAESGTPVGADDIKAYFEKLRGDEEAMRAAGREISGGNDEGNAEGEGDGRREQSGY